MTQDKHGLEQRVKQGFNAQGFMHFIGATLQKVDSGYVEIMLPYKPELTQQHGLFHGGVVATLADNAAGFAAYSMMSPQEQPLSIEFKINLFSKAKGNTLIARAKVLKNGKTIKVCQSDLFCISEDGEYPCATALVSVIAIEEN